MPVTLLLPWPPSVNHYKRVGKLIRTKNGKIYQPRINSRSTLAYYLEVAKRALLFEPVKIAQGSNLQVTLLLHPPDKRKRDIDNILKVLLDSLVHANLIEDDFFIKKLVVEKFYPIKDGKVFVTIQEKEP